jgi:hypothetical protein
LAGKASLDTLAALQQQQRQLAGELARYETQLGGRTLERLQRDRGAQLIDEEQFLRESYQLSQVAQARMSLEEKQLELSDRIRRLSREVEARESARSASAGRAPSYDALLVRRERARSVAEGASALDEEQVLDRALEQMDRALSEYDDLLGTLRAAPLLRAAAEPLHLAFVPYDNQPRVTVGSPVYACRLVVLACQQVGRVQGYLQGEHRGEHPVFGQQLRGQLVELALDDVASAKAGVLHANRPPLFF